MNFKKYRISMKMGYSMLHHDLAQGIMVYYRNWYRNLSGSRFHDLQCKGWIPEFGCLRRSALTDIETNRNFLNLPWIPIKNLCSFEDTYSLEYRFYRKNSVKFWTIRKLYYHKFNNSMTVNLAIAPNGEPGIQIGEPNISINNLGQWNFHD